jgi:DNA-binding transcriptional ArsR family regulator
MLNYQQKLDSVFRTLAVPARRSIVEQLSNGPASVSELARPLKMSLPAVVQHIQVLEASGIIRTEKTGRVRRCRQQPKALGSVEDWFAKQRGHWERKLDRLAMALGE